MKQQYHTLEERIDQVEGNERRQLRDLLNNQDEFQHATRNLNLINIQIINANEELDASKINLLQVIEELENFKGIARFIYDEVANELELESNYSKQEQSITKLRQQYGSGKVTCNSARNESDIAGELQRKLIILSPKLHENSYLDRFSKAYIVHHDLTVPRSKVTGLLLKHT